MAPHRRPGAFRLLACALLGCRLHTVGFAVIREREIPLLQCRRCGMFLWSPTSTPFGANDRVTLVDRELLLEATR